MAFMSGWFRNTFLPATTSAADDTGGTVNTAGAISEIALVLGSS